MERDRIIKRALYREGGGVCGCVWVRARVCSYLLHYAKG